MTTATYGFGCLWMGLALGYWYGCTPATADRAAFAARQADYGAELNACYVHGKSYAEYEACAQKADARFGVKP